MAESSVGLRLKCDCSGKAQKQLYSNLQIRFLVREDALIAKRRNCQTTEEEQDKIWSRIPKGGPIPRLTGRLTVGRKKNSNSNKAILLVGLRTTCSMLSRQQYKQPDAAIHRGGDIAHTNAGLCTYSQLQPTRTRVKLAQMETQSHSSQSYVIVGVSFYQA
jgi:hypothetical protein